MDKKVYTKGDEIVIFNNVTNKYYTCVVTKVSNQGQGVFYFIRRKDNKQFHNNQFNVWIKGDNYESNIK